MLHQRWLEFLWNSKTAIIRDLQNMGDNAPGPKVLLTGLKIWFMEKKTHPKFPEWSRVSSSCILTEEVLFQMLSHRVEKHVISSLVVHTVNHLLFYKDINISMNVYLYLYSCWDSVMLYCDLDTDFTRVIKHFIFISRTKRSTGWNVIASTGSWTPVSRYLGECHNH